MTQTQRQSMTLEDRLNAAEDLAGGNLTHVDYTAAVTMVKAMAGKVITVTSATGVAFTVPQDSDDKSGLEVGDWCIVRQGGAGIVTITAGTGATLRKAAATAKILAQYGEVTVRKLSANTYSVNGELAAA